MRVRLSAWAQSKFGASLKDKSSGCIREARLICSRENSGRATEDFLNSRSEIPVQKLRDSSVVQRRNRPYFVGVSRWRTNLQRPGSDSDEHHHGCFAGRVVTGVLYLPGRGAIAAAGVVFAGGNGHTRPFSTCAGRGESEGRRCRGRKDRSNDPGRGWIAHSARIATGRQRGGSSAPGVESLRAGG